MDDNSNSFIQALQKRDLEALRKIPKADLHNHFVLGGCRTFIKEKTGIEIIPNKGVLHSMEEMHQWNDNNLGKRFESLEMRQLMIDATFIQAVKDGVKILEIGEDAWGLDVYYQSTEN